MNARSALGAILDNARYVVEFYGKMSRGDFAEHDEAEAYFIRPCSG
jgi:hypothetical protein